MSIAPDVGERLARFEPTEIGADLSGLSASQKEVLDHLIAASREMNAIFLRQAWTGNPEMREALASSDDPLAPQALDYFDISFGPWDRLDESAFVGTAARPEGAGFYPDDMTKEEFEAWLEANPADREAFRSLYTVIRRDGDRLVAVPYSEAFAEWLGPAAEHLRAAAAATESESLRDYLTKVAIAFAADDYYDSDVAWMDLDSRVEVTIGPYETYEDRMFGYKASFESFVTVADPEQSAALARYKSLLPDMERNLPIPEEHKNPNRGSESPIRVVDEVFTAGDTRAGVQTIAFNLPNDERVREAKGSNKVLLRNVMDAKFQSILVPIANVVLAPEQAGMVDAESFFNEVLFHELSHGLGPGRIFLDGRETEVRLELKELYSPMEEAKADVMGVYNILYLMDRGLYPGKDRKALLATYVAGLFRATRFGVAEAHGRGAALQFHYLLEKGGVAADESRGIVTVDFEAMEPAIRGLVRDLCLLQAMGDYAGTREMLDSLGVLTPAMEIPLGRMEDIPVDIRPVYPAAGD
jgi:hypothetical protein